MNGRMRVSVVATGIDAAAVKQKKQAYEEMAVARQQSESFEQTTTGTAEASAAEDKSFPAFGVAKNSDERDAPRKRTPSLFERLTGMKKSFSSDRKEDFSVQQTKTRSTQEEDLEIPAFLRKSS
jgi:hypothetical protein